MKVNHTAINGYHLVKNKQRNKERGRNDVPQKHFFIIFIVRHIIFRNSIKWKRRNWYSLLQQIFCRCIQI